MFLDDGEEKKAVMKAKLDRPSSDQLLTERTD
jgi:hypothetical protein